MYQHLPGDESLGLKHLEDITKIKIGTFVGLYYSRIGICDCSSEFKNEVTSGNSPECPRHPSKSL